MEDIKYVRMKDEHKEAALQNIIDFFFEDEVLIRGTDCCHGGDKHPEIIQFMMDLMEHDLSIVALTENGDIAGVALSSWSHKDECQDLEEELRQVQDPKFRSIMRFMSEANIKADLFNKFCVDKIFYFGVISVDSKFRGRGIGLNLLKETENLAREVGATIMSSDFTGHFSQRISEKLGWELAYEIKYDEYKDENGEVVFKLGPPHTKLQVKYKILD